MREVQRSFADEFEHVLVESDTSIRRLARLSGVPRRTLENWLYGHTSRPRHIEQIFDVASALHLTPRDTDRLLRAAEHPTLVQLKQQSEWRESESSIPLTGRSAEWQKVQQALQTALQGQTRWVSIRGEAGIGKSRLAEELIRRARSQGIFTARTHTFQMEGSLAYAAVAELLRQYHKADRLNGLSETWHIEVARLLPELIEGRTDLEPPGPLIENWQRTRFYEALSRALLADDSPAVLVMDDLQWLDQESLDWLHYLMRLDTRANLLVVGLFRDHAIDPDHPLTKLLSALQQDDRLTDIKLRPLNIEDSVSLAENVLGNTLGTEEQEKLITYFEGNPLFIIETIRSHLTRAETNTGSAGGVTLRISPPGNAAELPPKIIAVIQSRFASLSTAARSLMELAAVFGRSFDFQFLSTAGAAPDDKLVEVLDELWRRRIIREQDANIYNISHDLIREVAAAQISVPQSRALHLRIARALETLYAGDMEGAAWELAVHFEKAGRLEPAVAYYEQAALVDKKMGALRNVIFYLEKGIGCLHQIPRSPQNIEKELMLQLNLGFALFQVGSPGDPAVEAAFSKAQRLAEISGQHEELFRAMYGLVTFYMMRSDLQKMLDLSRQCLVLAQRTDDTGQQIASHMIIGVARFFKGDFLEATEHLQQVCDLYDPVEHRILGLMLGLDPGVAGYAYLGLSQGFLGYGDRALKNVVQARSVAGQLQHPFTEMVADFYRSEFHCLRQEAPEAKAAAQRVMEITTKYELNYFFLQSKMMNDWAVAFEGREQEQMMSNLIEMTQAYRASGSELAYPSFLNLLAEVCLLASSREDALAYLDEALHYQEKNGERYVQAETYRLCGEALLPDDPVEAEAAFRRGIAVAEKQEAKSMHLRCTVSLCRLWQRQGREAEAHRLLSEICDWFEEGYDTPDLLNANVLLGELQPSHT